MLNFYRTFAAYYNNIFPLAGGKENFFHNLLVNYSPKTALDLGCATGELTTYLNKQGCETTGIDLSPDLLKHAQGKPGAYILADMVEYLETKPRQKKDLLICIGNTLPHLEPAQLDRFMKVLPNWLADNGLLVIQTVNYHKVLVEKPLGLRTIERPDLGIKFTRLYSYDAEGSIVFTAIMDSPQGHTQSEVTLWPLTAAELIQKLPNDIKPVDEYGSFDRAPFLHEHSAAWIMIAQFRG